MKFSDIPSHDSVKARLRAMADDRRIPHAILLEGPAGIGKFAMARAFAQYVHCRHRTPDGEPCGECASCRQHESFNHIDTFFSYPVVKTERFKNLPPVSADFIEEWRKFLVDNPFMDFDSWAAVFDKKTAQPVIYVTESDVLMQKVATTAHASDYKIIIMWLPERMNEDCANKLLKLIEEPHDDTLFIMTSDSPEDILPTILSRCQRVEMRRLPDEDIARYLVENMAVDPTEAQALAHIADGSIVRALQLTADSGASRRFFDLFVRLMRDAYQRKVSSLRVWASDLSALGRETEIKFYDYCQRLIRENFIYNFANPDINYMTGYESDFSRNFAKFITERNAEPLINAFNDARRDVAGNGNGKIVNFDLAIRVILLLKNG